MTIHHLNQLASPSWPRHSQNTANTTLGLSCSAPDVPLHSCFIAPEGLLFPPAVISVRTLVPDSLMDKGHLTNIFSLSLNWSHSPGFSIVQALLKLPHSLFKAGSEQERNEHKERFVFSHKGWWVPPDLDSALREIKLDELPTRKAGRVFQSSPGPVLCSKKHSS